jgi:hypothetical protein
VSIAKDFDRMVAQFMRDDPLTVFYLSVQNTYDDLTGVNTRTEVRIPCKAIFLDYQLRSSGDGTKPATLIQEGDKLLYMQPPNKADSLVAPLVIDPSADRVEIEGVVYKIVIFKQTNPSAANCLLFELYLRA